MRSHVVPQKKGGFPLTFPLPKGPEARVSCQQTAEGARHPRRFSSFFIVSWLEVREEEAGDAVAQERLYGAGNEIVNHLRGFGHLRSAL